MSRPTQGRVLASELRPPASQVRTSCGFCEGGHGQPLACATTPAGGQGHLLRRRPGLTLAVAVAMLSRARASSTLAGPWACLQASIQTPAGPLGFCAHHYDLTWPRWS